MYIKKFKEFLLENDNTFSKTMFLFNVYFLDKRHLLRKHYEEIINSDITDIRKISKLSYTVLSTVNKHDIDQVKPLNEKFYSDLGLYWEALLMYFDPNLVKYRPEMDKVIYSHFLKYGKITKNTQIKYLFAELNNTVIKIKEKEKPERIY